MALKKIPISQLKPGMYVTKLDISWIDSPFMYHHIKVKNTKQIDKLVKAGVKNISIDTEKGDDVKLDLDNNRSNVSEAVQKPDESSNDDGVISESETLAHKTSLKNELRVAEKLKGQVTELSNEINEALKNDEAVDPKLVSPLIDDTVQSLQRNCQALAALINMQRKDQNLANHAFGTFSLVLSLGLKLELNEQEIESLGMAAFFHDSGWLKLPLHLLGKKSAYTSSEKKLIQQHVPLGVKLLKTKSHLSDLTLRLLMEHHEHLDGSGFPKGLLAEKLHPLSRIFQVAVRYDELVHGLLDKPALTPNGALSQLYKESKANRLDGLVVTKLVGLLSVYPVGSAVLLSNKEKGVVVDTNSDAPKMPVVNVYYDASGVASASAKELNLAKQKNNQSVSIVSVLNLNDPSADPANLLGLI